MLDAARAERRDELTRRLVEGEPLSAAELRELRALATPDAMPAGYVMSIERLAEVLGCCKRTVAYLVAAGLKANEAGWFNVETARAFRAARKGSIPEIDESDAAAPANALAAPTVAAAEVLGEEDDEDDRDWTLEFRRAKAELLMLQLEEKRGNLVHRDLVQAGWDARTEELRDAFTTMAEELSPRLIGLSPAEIRKALDEALWAALATYGRAPRWSA